MKTKIEVLLQGALGLAFVVFGLNKFFGFMPGPDLPLGAEAFFTALAATDYMVPLIGATEVVGGALVLARLYSALGLVILAPVSVNIVLFHLSLAPSSGVPAYVLAGLNLYFLFVYLPKYRPLLSAK